MEYNELETKLLNVGLTQKELEKQGFKYQGPIDILHQFQYKNKTYFFNDIKIRNQVKYKLYNVVNNAIYNNKDK